MIERERAMTLEKTDVVDIVLKPQDGKITLVVVDAGTTSDPQERYALLLKKLETYVAYATSGGFREQHPHIPVNNVNVRVICAIPPTEEMTQILTIGPSGDRINRMAVEFEEWKPDQG
jgi:hypothetical protein